MMASAAVTAEGMNATHCHCLSLLMFVIKLTVNDYFE